MDFGIMFQLQTPRPIDADQWHEHDELKIYHEALDQIELADKLGYDYVFITEHHFLEEYCHSSVPEVFLAAAAARIACSAVPRRSPCPCGAGLSALECPRIVSRDLDV